MPLPPEEQYDPANREHVGQRLRTSAACEQAWASIREDHGDRIEALSTGAVKPTPADWPIFQRCLVLVSAELEVRKWNAEHPEEPL